MSAVKTITLPILKLQGGAKTCLELINLKSVRERKSTVSEKEWQPPMEETYSREDVQRAEKD